jgi:hypothetical protein
MHQFDQHTSSISKSSSLFTNNQNKFSRKKNQKLFENFILILTNFANSRSFSKSHPNNRNKTSHYDPHKSHHIAPNDISWARYLVLISCFRGYWPCWKRMDSLYGFHAYFFIWKGLGKEVFAKKEHKALKIWQDSNSCV